MGKRWTRFLDRFRAFARGGCLAAFALLAAHSDALAAAGDHTLSGDSKWVVIASRESLSEAIGIAQTYASDKSKVFQSENGWYAVVLGPVKSRTIDDFRARYSGPDLPSDAYLAKGSNFVSKAWPQAQSASGSGYKLSDGNKWVVIASREDLSEAIGIAQTYASENAQIFKSENGWYAVVLGPYQQSTIDDFRASYFGPELPSDAYLAKGSNFVAKAWPSTQTAAATQSEAKQQAASVATMSRTVDFGDIAFEYALPASFDYLGRDDDAVYFGEGDTVAEFAWISLNDDTLESMVDEVRSSPELYREDGYFKDGLEFSITKEEVKGNRFWADWKDAEKRYSRMTYAVVACCGNYVRFTLERPFGVAVDGWIQEFYDSFRNSSGSPVVDDGSLTKWTLPSASTPALSDAQKLYDVCSSHWNEKKYAGKMGFKAIGAYFAASKIWCSSRAGMESAGAAWAAVKEACQKAGAEDCYQFAIGDELSGWADDESDAVEYGSRAREYQERQVASRPKPAPTYSQNSGGYSDGGGSVLNDVLDIGGALLNGWNQGTAIGNALNGGGGGGGYSSGGGGSSGACAQFRSNANTCRQRQMSLGGGTDPGTQAGSFYECYQMYTNAAIAAGC